MLRVRMTKNLQNKFRSCGDEKATVRLTNEYFIHASNDVIQTCLNDIKPKNPVLFTDDGYRYIEFELYNLNRMEDTCFEYDAMTIFFAFGCIADLVAGNIIEIRRRTFSELRLVMQENKDLLDYIDFITGEIHEEYKINSKRVPVLTSNIGARQFMGRVPDYDYTLIAENIMTNTEYIPIATCSLDKFINNAEEFNIAVSKNGRKIFVYEDSIHGDDTIDDYEPMQAVIIPTPLIDPFNYRRVSNMPANSSSNDPLQDAIPTSTMGSILSPNTNNIVVDNPTSSNGDTENV